MIKDWSGTMAVLAVDAEEAGLAALRARIPAPAAERIRLLCASFTEADLRVPS